MASTTIKDVAAAAGVSVGTASMALNSKKGVNEETRKRVLAVADELGYRPNKYARYLTSKRTNTVGLIVTDITNPFFGLIIDFIQQDLEARGYDLVLGISAGSITKERKLIEKFINLHVDGVITVPSHKQSADVRHFAELQKRAIPLCFITTYYSEVDAPCVMTDISSGSYDLTRHLLETGHRSILYIVASLALPLARLRVEGYRAAFLERGLPMEADWIVVVDEPSFECGYQATGRILERGKPDAILAMNDVMALGALKRIKESGYGVPGDISVAGYDDLLYTTLLETPLTTVHQPVEEMCRRAVESLFAHIQDYGQLNEKIFLPPKLLIRASTGGERGQG